jgi:hypothetical protein
LRRDNVSKKFVSGLGIPKLKAWVQYFLIMNYEWADPKRYKLNPKTGSLTPFSRNVSKK